MKQKTEQETVITSDLRDTLKQIVKKEIDNLSSNIESLETKDRITIVLKLLPFVFPKIETIRSDDNEPSQWI
jgi:hypothetical protein